MSIRVWDIVVRLCHWGIVVLLPLCWLSAEEGEMEWHQTFAYLLAALLFTRLCWAIIGSETARFSHFVRSPSAVVGYLVTWRQARTPHLGHNPAGGYMVLVMWTLMLLQWGSGLFTTDDILTEGPLYAAVSESISSTLTFIHHQAFYVLVGIVVLHVIAIVVYRMRGMSLLPPMLHGKAKIDVPQPQMKHPLLGMGLLMLWLGVFGYGLVLPLW
ncbi:cytochrome b/b6 domain-containing protein [Ferrimonas lipolytica]|uniref:Cytochrome B n=1 Tax=Ferrimonas lipolytica TaxID=2724191 RepID=A0A6H1UAE0_9GAMM|nr:cytochrome b/b6 domain-containing protein [Ferrimonas lipolytica]QIZ75550.1 cytochrome B [Ferrimonas lipolytica]